MGSDNILIGLNTGMYLTTGCRNIAIGPRSFQRASSASDCIVIGADAGNWITTEKGIVVFGETIVRGWRARLLRRLLRPIFERVVAESLESVE